MRNVRVELTISAKRQKSGLTYSLNYFWHGYIATCSLLAGIFIICSAGGGFRDAPEWGVVGVY